MKVRLRDIERCFHGIVPGSIATCSADGTPNVTYLSHVKLVDDDRVALSCQFFNKTRKNISDNPYACVEVYDPVDLQAYRLVLQFDHAETEGPLFDDMALRIQAIASHTGMSGVFRLLSADVYQVLELERREGFLLPRNPTPDEDDEPRAPRSEVRGLQTVSLCINRARDLEELLVSTLDALDPAFGFDHSMILLLDETGERLFTVASHGYGESGIGAEVSVGAGLIGTVAEQRRMVRLASTDAELRYGRAVRGRMTERAGGEGLRPEIPLPGLADARSHMVLPLVVGARLVGVLSLESRSPICFDNWHEAYMEILANQIAMGIDRMQALEEDDEEPPPSQITADVGKSVKHQFCFYKNDDCVFVDGEYLIRNVPGKILWKILTSHVREGRIDFTNRELRLDTSLGLPPIKDNLESRLILLRKRLEQKCPDIRLVSTGRGRFALEMACHVELVERDSS